MQDEERELTRLERIRGDLNRVAAGELFREIKTQKRAKQQSERLVEHVAGTLQSEGELFREETEDLERVLTKASQERDMLQIHVAFINKQLDDWVREQERELAPVPAAEAGAHALAKARL